MSSLILRSYKRKFDEATKMNADSIDAETSTESQVVENESIDTLATASPLLLSNLECMSSPLAGIDYDQHHML